MPSRKYVPVFIIRGHNEKRKVTNDEQSRSSRESKANNGGKTCRGQKLDTTLVARAPCIPLQIESSGKQEPQSKC